MTSVIVVDDNEDIVFSMSELLEMHGIDVVGKGYNGLEGVQLFEKFHPDVVLLDMMMPEYDGLYALRKIRELDPKSIVIIVTGCTPTSLGDELESLNPTKIIFKPVDMNILVETILNESNNSIPFKIQYSFNDDSKSYSCIMTFDQYLNFKQLPVVRECRIVKHGEENNETYKNEMKKALTLAAKNDLSHIQKLSQLI
ncbi:MAG: response regulator [Nitrosopumilus sp.]|nr:response regulator [Nitrosopumilus sp.]